MVEEEKEKGSVSSNIPKATTPVSTSEVPQHVGSSLSNLNLFNNADLVAAENFLTKIVRSEKGGIKTVNDGLAVLMRAQDLGLPFSSCLEHIHVINGKTGIDIHLIKALLLKAGCTWECLKDYQPLYEYTDGFNVYSDGALPDYCRKVKSRQEAEEAAKNNNNKDDIFYVYPVKFYKDNAGNIYKEYQLNMNKCAFISNKLEMQEAIKAGKIPVFRIPSIPIDYVMEYKITRVINGKTITAIGHFSYSEAVTAEMFKKDTYKYYARILIGHRAFTYAARDIASDILFGVRESSELKIINNVDLDTNDFEDVETY